ncbi:MAG: shikimate dehydrogenase [Myxococcales bacterium]|nr:shikimate dehydrogenase [Myxococcales bacterium]
MTTAKTRLLALLGHPVSHSRSPAMMTGALAAIARAQDFSYLAFDVRPEELQSVLVALRAMNCAGANVTVPHKRAVIGLCSVVDDDARRIGAANVLSPLGQGWAAHNTDAPGAARALTDAGVSIAGSSVLLVGAGGAARAVAVGLAREGCRSLTVVARSLSDAHDCVRACDGLGVREASVIAWNDDTSVAAAHARADVLVQCTPLGMQRSNTPLSVPEPEYDVARGWLSHARPGATAMDLVYAPVVTPWLRVARDRGLRTVDGLGMLAHQGALALARWCGGAPPASAFRRFLDEAESGG